MNIRVLGFCCVAVAFAAPAPAAGRETAVFPIFKQVCLDTDGDPAASIAAAKALGLAQGPEGPRRKHDGEVVDALDGQIGLRRITAKISEAERAPGRVVNGCTVALGGQDSTAAAALREWATGSPSTVEEEHVVLYAYRQTEDGRVPIAPDDNAAAAAAAEAGLLGTVGIDAAHGSVSLVLVRMRRPLE